MTRDLIAHSRMIGNEKVSLLCPHCRQNGTFETFGVNDVQSLDTQKIYGQRRCPNIACNGHVFVVLNSSGVLFTSHPKSTIPFDTTNIPVGVLTAFREAIICHSNECFIASAIMIRKTLEEIAEDKGIKADNLKKRIEALGKKIVVPQELIQAMDELRLLGNDAAHIEAKTYEEIGNEEIEISIEFTKEILKATYQYEDLLTKLRSLKQTKVE